ncbi:MAG: hypothetical protein UU21_C0019G0003 [Candidatus Levybacteria bacterium GW2011_GWA2_40_8]|nr:MAG: hypothetical protein UU21_C0019G0003 [Candidatus Levybacteria bacterium GW2011_GWA2_40_8]
MAEVKPGQDGAPEAPNFVTKKAPQSSRDSFPKAEFSLGLNSQADNGILGRTEFSTSEPSGFSVDLQTKTFYPDNRFSLNLGPAVSQQGEDIFRINEDVQLTKIKHMGEAVVATDRNPWVSRAIKVGSTIAFVAACAGQTPPPTENPTVPPTAVPSASPTELVTPMPTAEPTPTWTDASPEPTATIIVTQSPPPSHEPTITPEPISPIETIVDGNYDTSIKPTTIDSDIKTGFDNNPTTANKKYPSGLTYSDFAKQNWQDCQDARTNDMLDYCEIAVNALVRSFNDSNDVTFIEAAKEIVGYAKSRMYDSQFEQFVNNLKIDFGLVQP